MKGLPDAVQAAGDVSRRVGATGFEVRWSGGDPRRFGCHAKLRGRPVEFEAPDDEAGVVLAADAFAHVLLNGETCEHCEQRTTTRDLDPWIYERFGRAKRARCIWWRDGDKWRRGCEE